MKPVCFVWVCALLCLQLGLAVGQTTINPPATSVCGLDGFDLNTLEMTPYWKFTVPDKTQCLIPEGVTTDQVQSCSINFAVCHALPADTLCANMNSSMCQEVLLTNGTKYDYSIGTYDPSNTYKVEETGRGFVAERTGMEIADTTCNGTFSTIFIFTCNLDATWSTSQTNVTSYLSSFLRNSADQCQYLIQVDYSGACYSFTPSNCQLKGYNIAALARAPFWKFQVPDKTQCLIPEGVTTDQVQSCSINFAVCHALPADTLCVDTNSSMCQRILLDNGTMYDYSIGTYDPGHTYEVEETGHGVVAERTGMEGAHTTCNGTFSTIFIFACNSGATWSKNQTNVTSYLSSFLRNSADPCQYLIQVNYSGACYSFTPNQCQLDDYDIATLASQEYWYADIDKSLCLNATDTCRFYFSFCHPIPPEVMGACYGSGVCQVGDKSPNTTYGLGLFQNTTIFYPNVDVIDGGFHVDYENGSAPSFLPNCTTHGLRSRVVFVCNSSVRWTQLDQSNNIHVAWDRTFDPCMYSLEFQYSGACISVGPTTVTTEPVSVVGWVLIGIFLGLVLVYLVVGMAFQYFVKKERGLRILPNYDFWSAFVMLVLEGCRFFLDAITCFMFEGKIKTKVEYDKI